MNYKFHFSILIIIIFSACKAKVKSDSKRSFVYNLDTITLFDQSRIRQIPVAFYKPQVNRPKLIIISHGYAQNKSGSYLEYSYLGEYLASKGYFVASIQHELPTDSIIPNVGKPQIVRMPFWSRGGDNILFVINELKRIYPELDFKHISLIGHSNGGDMVALFPQKYPGVVERIITLDNRRMALPKIDGLKVISLRSCDQPADEGVLPTLEEEKKYGIKIVTLKNTKHNDMDDRGNVLQKKEIIKYIMTFLNE